MERLITILSSFEESTIVSSSDSSIGSSVSEDSYESLGVITQLKDFIVREIGNVMDDSMYEDDDYSQAGYWAREVFSQDFSVLPSKYNIVKSEEWKRKTGGTVEEILACSTNETFSLLPMDIPPVQSRRKKEVHQRNDSKVAEISTKSLSESARIDDIKVKKSKQNRCHLNDSLKEIQTNNLPARDIQYKLTSASFGGQNRCTESHSVRKSQSNASQSIRKKSETSGLSKLFHENATFHGPAHDVQTDNTVESVKLKSERGKDAARDYQVDENLRETTDDKHDTGDLIAGETIAANNQVRNIGLSVRANEKQVMNDCQRSRCAEETEPSCRQLQGHMMKNRRSLKLMTSKFQSIITTIESRKKMSDWKIMLFKGSDRAKRQIGCLKSAEEEGDDGPHGLSEPDCANNSLSTVPCSVAPNKCLQLGSEKKSSEECFVSNNVDANKNLEAFLVGDNLAKSIPVLSMKSLQADNVDQSTFLDVGQEVVGEFESSIVTPKRNLGDLLRRPFRKSQNVPHLEHAYKRDTLIEANIEPVTDCQEELNSERECHENGGSSSNSIATESTKSLHENFSGSTKPENHHRRKEISVATKREIQRLISDMASLKNVESSNVKLALKSLKELAVLRGTVQEQRPYSDNEQQKSYSLFGVADDFTNIFSCNGKTQ